MKPRPSAPSAGLADRIHAELLQRTAGPDRGDVAELVRRELPLADDTVVAETVQRVEARMFGLGELDGLLADPTVTDVMVSGHGVVWIEANGTVERTELQLAPDDVERLVERIVTPLGLRADRVTPLVDARLADGSRVHIAMPPLAVDGPYVTVRRFGTETLPLEAFATEGVAELLRAAVQRRANIVVCGGTGAGKTTLLNALCQLLPATERVVTVEDAAELRLPGDHVIRLESRPATPDGLAAVTIRDLVRAALRMRPDRIVVGEVRSGEALDMLQALNTGHDGSLSTVHANGPVHALRRLETLALTGGVEVPHAAVRDQLCGAVDLVVHVRRGAAGSRCIDGVDAVTDDPDDPNRTTPLVRAGHVVEAGPCAQ